MCFVVGVTNRSGDRDDPCVSSIANQSIAQQVIVDQSAAHAWDIPPRFGGQNPSTHARWRKALWWTCRFRRIGLGTL